MSKEIYEGVEFEVDRPKGFLTAEDIRWVMEGDTEGFTTDTIRQKRRRVRKRLRAAILDFGVLFAYLSEEELERAFDIPDDWDDQMLRDRELGRFITRAKCALAVMYEGLGEDLFIAALEMAIGDIEAGTRTQHHKPAPHVGAEVHIQTPETVNGEDLVAKLDHGNLIAFTNAELSAILAVMQETGSGMPRNGDEFLELVAKSQDADDQDIDDLRLEMPSYNWPVFAPGTILGGEDGENGEGDATEDGG